MTHTIRLLQAELDCQMVVIYHRCMKPFGNVAKSRNILIGAGAFYMAGWLTFPLVVGFDKLTQGIIYSGDFEATVTMPLVEHFPKALVAAMAGAAVVWLVESDRPVVWVIFPALLYAVLGFLGYHWARHPVLLDRVTQIVGALFPAVTCIIGGIVAARRRTRANAAQVTHG